MSENFASFYRKASSVRELVGKAPFPEKVRFQITKVIELPTNQYRRYMNELLRDVSFISRNVADMRFDGKTETFLCLFVTCRDANTGLLVEADAARQLGLRRTDHVELVCGGDYLTTVWKKDYRGSFGWDSLEVLHAEILRRGFRAVGDTFSSILASREQPDGSIINYHLTRTKIYT